MKRKYICPKLKIHIVEIEESISTASSTLTPSNVESDFVSEYEQLPNDERTFEW